MPLIYPRDFRNGQYVADGNATTCFRFSNYDLALGWELPAFAHDLSLAWVRLEAREHILWAQLAGPTMLPKGVVR